MSWDALCAEVVEANQRIERAGLVVLSFGNASAVDRARGVFAIKPSGVPYPLLTPADIVVVALDDGRVVQGDRRPSSDAPTHRVLYQRYPAVGGVVHTHSAHATAWAQARREVPAFGTTHADSFAGPVPVTRPLTAAEIGGEYEHETGRVIVERMDTGGLDPVRIPGILVASHGPFTWGPTVSDAVTTAIALEAIAGMALRTLQLRPDAAPVEDALLERHFSRKHGPSAYYGQPPEHEGRGA